MPFGKVDKKPLLTDEESWDVAAFVNDDTIHFRSKSMTKGIYLHVEEKPIDYDLEPFADPFSAIQHKFGPFQPIINYRLSKTR